MRLIRMTTGAFFGVAVSASALAGCATDDAGPQRGEPFEYATHCGVGQVDVDGITYYPTAVFDGDNRVTENDPSWHASSGGPTPWIRVENERVVYVAGAADANSTHGTLELIDADGTAVFHVEGGRWSIHLSADPTDAAWIIDGCA